jgi:hypothetical protein
VVKILVTLEAIIQRLLSEAGVGGIGDELVSVDARGIEAAAVGGSLKSPENYAGYGRIGNLCVTRRYGPVTFASPGGIMP